MPGTRIPHLLAAATLAFASLSAGAADADRGRDLAWTHRCMTCHGETGVSSDPRYPHLAGQKPMYIVSRLQYFRSGQEPFNQMNGQAAPLSDQDMQDIAAYFSEQRR